MKESLINPISSVRPLEPGVSPKVSMPTHTENAATNETVVAEAEKSLKQADGVSTQDDNFSNVSIHFRLDEKTHELTLFVVDKKSKRVLRSIPASELHKLKSGELLRLTA